MRNLDAACGIARKLNPQSVAAFLQDLDLAIEDARRAHWGGVEVKQVTVGILGG